MPMTMIRIDAYSTSPAVVQILEAMRVETFSRRVIETPRSPCSAPFSQYQYWTRNGWSRW